MKRLFRSKFSSALAIMTSLTLVTGCASIVGKSSPQMVTINSSPSEASLRIENLRTGATMYSGKTPYTVTLERSAGYFKSARYNVVIEKNGYQTTQFIIEGSLNGWYLGGNLIFGGLIGYLIVDPLTGAMWTLSPETINASLATKASMLETQGGLVIILKGDVPETLFDKMTPIVPVN